MSIEIRPVQKGDEKILAYIQTESWKSAFASILSPDVLMRCTDLQRATDMYRKLIERDIGNGFLLFVDGQPHCIAWWDASREADMPEYAELICIHSLINRWHQGYGSKMMEFVLEDIANSEFSNVMLWVFAENHRARSFYESCGFMATERVKESFGAVEICYVRKIKR